MKTAKSVLRLLHKVEKTREEELAKFEPLMEEYLASDEYKTFSEKMKNKADDEDEYKADHDPKGYFAFKKLLKNELDIFDFVQKVCSVNQDPVLHAKAIPAFLKRGKSSFTCFYFFKVALCF